MPDGIFMRQARRAAALASTLALLCAAQLLKADDFDDFKVLFDKLAASMNEAMQLPQDSIIVVEYEKDLSSLEVKARMLQAGLTKLKVDWINLPRTVSMLPEVYSAGRAKALKSKIAEDHVSRSMIKNTSFIYKKLYDPKGKPIEYDCREDLVALIREQIEQLEAMNFSMNGESVSIDNCAFKPSSQLERLLNNYTRNIVVVSSLHRGSLWRDHFEKSLRHMVQLANEMHKAMIAKDFKLGMSANLQAGAASLREIYNGIPKTEINDKASSQQNSVRLQSDSSAKHSIETVEKESCYVADKLAKAILAYRSLGLDEDAEEPDSPGQGQAQAEKPTEQQGVQADPKQPAPLPGQPAPIAKESLAPLWKPILAERERVWNADAEMVGASKETVDAYAKTFTKKEKEIFDKTVKLYAPRLVDKSLAESNALREMHMRTNEPEEFTSKDELQKLLKALGKEPVQ